MARDILRREGLRGIYRGLTVTALRDAPAHGVYFWTYEYARERLHPGCRHGRDEVRRGKLHWRQRVGEGVSLTFVASETVGRREYKALK
ncbi:hypothetical protein BAE44_0007843 [Dichanthelium oligosanthes]|uniref:Uncharacterized protein n=1 Tax=Dichanthelium oligosanthes TaxID=888268 RepID=A0A1E5W1B1_9POAL|nr:hypothetical protein BAE44_0007843 [Dichanthelium oligosanthes]